MNGGLAGEWLGKPLVVKKVNHAHQVERARRFEQIIAPSWRAFPDLRVEKMRSSSVKDGGPNHSG